MRHYLHHPLDGEVKMIRYVEMATPGGQVRFKAEPEVMRMLADFLALEPIAVETEHTKNRAAKDYYWKEFASLKFGEISLTLKSLPAEDIWQRRAEEGRNPDTGEKLPPPAPPEEPRQLEAPKLQLEDQSEEPPPAPPPVDDTSF